MHTRLMLIASVLLFARPVDAAILSGLVAEVDATLNKLVLMEYDALGNTTKRELVWDKYFPEATLLASAPVGFELAVEASATFPDNWEVKDVLQQPSVPKMITTRVVSVDV